MSLLHLFYCAAVHASRYVYDENNRPHKQPPAEEVASRAAWQDLYAGRNLSTAAVKWCNDLRLSIMKGEVLPEIQQVGHPNGSTAHHRSGTTGVQ